MAVSTEPKRRVILKFWEHAVERTEAQIEELKTHGIWVRDAGPEDQLAPHAAVTVSAPLPVPGSPAGTPPPPPAAGTPPKPKE